MVDKSEIKMAAPHNEAAKIIEIPTKVISAAG